MSQTGLSLLVDHNDKVNHRLFLGGVAGNPAEAMEKLTLLRDLPMRTKLIAASTVALVLVAVLFLLMFRGDAPDVTVCGKPVRELERGDGKILILSAFCDRYLDATDTVGRNHYAYAKHHGYSYLGYVPEEEPHKRFATLTWLKLDAFEWAFNLGYEWVFFVDADLVFMDFKHDLESLIAMTEDKDMLIGHINTGVWLIRNSEWPRKLLRDIAKLGLKEYSEKIGNEQNVFSDWTAQHPEWEKDHIKFVPYGRDGPLQSEYPFFATTDRIVHVAGKGKLKIPYVQMLVNMSTLYNEMKLGEDTWARLWELDTK